MEKEKNIDYLKKDRNSRITFFYFISGFSLLISIIALCGVFVFKGVVVEKESIVLVFVGILATFIVVGNYAQVKSIEQDFSQKVGELKHEFSKEEKVLKHEFSEKVKEMKLEFDKKVLLNQNFSVIQELYKKMVYLISIVEKIVSLPIEKRKDLINNNKESVNAYVNLLSINRPFLPSDVFILFKKIEELLSSYFNNASFITANNESNIEEETRIYDKFKADLKDIFDIREEINELIKNKYYRHE